MKRTNFFSASRSGLSVMAGLAMLAGCTNVERSRNWSNENVPGEVLAQQVCSTCHGIDGQSVNTLFPKLAGQKKEYLQSQLEAIRSRDRNSEHTRQFMWGPARSLTDKQIDAIATYFSSRPAMIATNRSAPADERGKILYYQGRPGHGVEACASCHGDSAEGDEVVPRLAGQHKYYLVSRARIAMTRNVAGLSDDEIASIATYLESIGEGGTAPARLKPTDEKFVAANIPDATVPPVFDAGGDARNCHYSVWTYGWYCGNFFEALVYHLKNQ